LCKDAPEPRAKQPPDLGAVIEISEVGGLHHLSFAKTSSAFSFNNLGKPDITC
jgi:hypothetical protein